MALLAHFEIKMGDDFFNKLHSKSGFLLSYSKTVLVQMGFFMDYLSTRILILCGPFQYRLVITDGNMHNQSVNPQSG